MRVTSLSRQYPRAIPKDMSPAELEKMYNLDTEILKLRKSLPKATQENMLWCLFNEPQLYSFGITTAATMFGKQLDVEARRKSDLKKIRQFNTRINTQGETIEDYGISIWLDQLWSNEGALWRPWKTDEQPCGLDLSRVDPMTITKVVHPTTGFTLFVQESEKWSKYNMEKYQEFFDKYDPFNPPVAEQVYVKIPNTRDAIIQTKFFDIPPIGPVVPLVVYKKWILWYMRKHSQKYWSPFTVAYLGNDNYMPSESEMEFYSSMLNTELPNMYNFSGIPLPGWIKLEQLMAASKGDANVYPAYIDLCNREITNGIFGSMSLRDADAGSAKGSSELSKNYISFLEGVQSKIDKGIRELYAFTLIGDGDPEDYTINWPIMRKESTLDVTAAIERLSKTGILDTMELRQAVHAAYAFVDPSKKVEAHQTPDLIVKKKQVETAASKPAGANKPTGTNQRAKGQPSTVRSK